MCLLFGVSKRGWSLWCCFLWLLPASRDLISHILSGEKGFGHRAGKLEGVRLGHLLVPRTVWGLKHVGSIGQKNKGEKN